MRTFIRYFKVLRSRSKCCVTLSVTAFVLFVSVNVHLELIRWMSSGTRCIQPKPSDVRLQSLEIPGINKKRPMVKHIRFLKVHKAASSTMQNVFFRFAYMHNLRVAVPIKGNYIRTRYEMVEPRTARGLYDIFATHTFYSKTWFDNMPVPSDAVNIAIVREPQSRFISAAYQYRNWGLNYLRKVPQKNYIGNLLYQSNKYDPGPFSPTRNSMARDFGFSQNKSKIDDHLSLLEKEFALVLIVERFDESLVMLKRLLNWQLEDIVYRVAVSSNHKPVNLTDNDIKQLKKLNYIDYAIYEHFAKIFDGMVKIEIQTDDFEDEVKHFKDTVQTVTLFCSRGIESFKKFKASKWNKEFTLDMVDCELLKTNEIAFIRLLKLKQGQNYWE